MHIDHIIAIILGVSAVVVPTWAILTDKKTYILTPRKK